MARKSRKNLPQPEQAAASVLLPELEEAKMPAAIYGRLSVEDEETEESMETQIALVQDYINRSRELSYVDTYFDNGFTGTNFKRPAFTRLMNDVRQKKIKCIVVKDLSRFGRNYLEAGYYIETVFPFLGVRYTRRPLALWSQLSGSRILYRNGVSVFGCSIDCCYR